MLLLGRLYFSVYDYKLQLGVTRKENLINCDANDVKKLQQELVDTD